MNCSGGFRASAAADASGSIGSTSQNRPNTVFSARKADAIPALDARKSRRLTPSRWALVRAVSSSSAATRCCSRVWGNGTYSSLEMTCVGTGENLSVSTSRLHFRTQRRARMLGLLQTPDMGSVLGRGVRHGSSIRFVDAGWRVHGSPPSIVDRMRTLLTYACLFLGLGPRQG